MNIAHHLIRTARVRGERPAIARGGTIVLSYRDLAGRASRLAGALARRLNLSPGDRVAMLASNCEQFIELLYACWHAGMVVVPINAKLHPSEFAYIMENSGAKVCFLTPGIVDDTAIDATVRCIEIGSGEYGDLLTTQSIAVCPRDPTDPAWLFYTSGTTGKPKGATLTHRNLIAMTLCYSTDVDPGAPWEAILHAAPMSHGSGLYGLAHVAQASCHVIAQSSHFEPEEIYRLIERWPHVSFFAAPTMVKRLVDAPYDADTGNLKTLIYGGGPMYVEDLLVAIDRLDAKLSQIYGQGETPMTITCLNATLHAERTHPRWLERLGSVGVAQSVVDVQVVDADDQILPAGEIGEIAVRGDTVMTGYWRNPNATHTTLGNGWLHTGDIGIFDEDGFLTLKDRSKDLIISGGANIYPREVEEILARDPTILEVSVIGVPDRQWGEAVAAYVVARPGCQIDTGALEQRCLANMARFKRPKFYRVVGALPKNNYGKVLKTELRQQMRDDQAMLR